LAYKLAKRVLHKKSSLPKLNREYQAAINNNLGQVFKNSVEYDAGERLHKIKCPTLIVWGDRDPDAPLFIGKLMHKLIKHSRLEVLPKTGHKIYLENPNLLYGIINKFI
jgi:pimeloyl-ACP methyl ester carboxylesterase